MLVHQHRPLVQPRPQVSAHLTLTMALMELPLDELQQAIDRALNENPALEIAPERRCPTCGRTLIEDRPCPVCRPPSTSPEEPIVFVSGSDLQYGYELGESSEEFPPLADRDETLPEYVFRQIRFDLAEEDRPIAAHLLANLDDDGLIRASMIELTAALRVPPARIQRVLDLIQSADPPGVGAQNEQEAMLIQLRHLAERTEVPPFTEAILREGLVDLAHHRYGQLARRLGATKAQVQRAGKFIRENLYPRPAQMQWGSHTQEPASVLRHPDIIIHHDPARTGGALIVEILMPLRAPLRVSPLFATSIHQAEPTHLAGLEKQLERAMLFTKCLAQRQHTIKRLMSFLVRYQRDYILHGDRYMRPLTRAEVARQLELHESTISRAVKDKVVQLPSGRLVPLGVFFDRSLHLRTMIRQMIEEEEKPLSDQQIANRLADEGFPIARRTVSKYRAMLRIPPAHQRKQGAESTP